MLVLTRKVGERLVIGDNIVVTINQIKGSRVTVGIDAPSTIRILRGEIKNVIPHSPDEPPTNSNGLDRPNATALAG